MHDGSDPNFSFWTPGFVLGELARLAEWDRTLALTGLAHFQVLFPLLMQDRPPDWPRDEPYHPYYLHERAVKAYWARVRVYREQGKSFEEATDSTFDYWLKVSTLDKGHPLLVPVKLADYHIEALTDPKTKQRHPINSSVTLNRRNNAWWLTLSYDEVVVVETKPDAPVIGIDVGIANFVTTSDGKQYGTFNGKLRERQKRDREKRRRKAKLRACLQKKGVSEERLSSTTSCTGQKLIRHVKQSINRAVKLCFEEHEDCRFAYEQLSVASMRFKAHAQNAYLRASQLGQIPKQIEWNAQKRGVQATEVKSAYSSQQCQICWYVDRANRPTQQTFCCLVRSHTTHADHNASKNIADRLHDEELRACKTRAEMKALLLRRHEQWKQQFRLVVVQPPVQLGLWARSQASTDVGEGEKREE